MEEVDRDQNHTLDFYEYLLVIDNIYKRNGKNLFHFIHNIRLTLHNSNNDG